ncbi:TPM domain-containing protein [bacterium]|nr:TPM domain-containing protein [bacterium]
MRRFSCRKAFWVLALAFLIPMALAAAQIPPVPTDDSFVNDYANLLTRQDIGVLGNIQRQAYEEHDVPIVVVTINSMAQYGSSGESIEDFARDWFDSWGIGSKAPGGNKGILLLVSLGDRKARIELGADWGSRWDYAANQVMQTDIIPRFKTGDYSGGIVAGVAKLGAFAAQDPETLPQQDFFDRLESTQLGQDVQTFSFFPFFIILLMAGLGVFLMILAIFFPEYRSKLLIAGGVLLAMAFCSWIIVGILAVFVRSRGGGGFGSSGGFGGGFSGGGGATGSW